MARYSEDDFAHLQEELDQDTARALGVGQRTGIDLPAESAGYLGSPDSVRFSSPAPGVPAVGLSPAVMPEGYGDPRRPRTVSMSTRPPPASHGWAGPRTRAGADDPARFGQ